MNENELEEAYKILRLKPGCTLEQVMSQHRLLAMIWHPDRIVNEQDKRFAEEELKKINQAKDVLEAHFNSLLQAETNTAQPRVHSEIAKWRQNEVVTQSNQNQKQSQSAAGAPRTSPQIGLRGWVLILVIAAALMMMGRNSNNVGNSTMYKQPQEEEVTRYYQIMDGGRKKIISRLEKVGEKPHLEPGMIPYGDLQSELKQLRDANNATSFKSTALLPANLAATPGVNAPLPEQTIQRSGLPLMPLGAGH